MDRLFKENQHILFFIFVLILGALFLFYGKLSTQDSDVVEKGKVVEDLKIDVPTENIVKINEPKIDILKSLKDKFNLALENGSKSFLNKNYNQAINYYNEALEYIESDIPYIRLYSIYNVLGDNTKALYMLDKAININDSYTDYWIIKLQFLDEKTDIGYQVLKKVYEEGFLKSNELTRINLVIIFARVSELNQRYEEAISLWTYAIELYPQNKTIYQAEIDRLKSLI